MATARTTRSPSLPGIKAPRFRTQPKRASVIGAGSFGTAVAILLVRAGMRTTLLCRTEEQARKLEEERENKHYLEGVTCTSTIVPRSSSTSPFPEAIFSWTSSGSS